MSQGPQPQRNVNNLPAVVPFVPTFGAATDANGNAYLNLGSSYTMSADGAQVLVSYKFRVTGAGTGPIANTISLPIPASATLGNLAVFPPTPLVVTATGASTISVTNNVAANDNLVLGLASGGVNLGASIYTVEILCKYMVVAANN